jgi:hypothetical protein
MINLLLAFLAVFFCINAYKIWYEDGDAGRKGDHIAKPDGQKRVPVKGGAPAKRLMPAESAYDIVAAHNLFSQDREEYLPDEPEAETEPAASDVKISGKTITLYGIVIMNEYKKALINNPIRGNDEPKDKWISVGDTVGNLTVAAIETESVSFRDGSKKYDVLLYDDKKQRDRSRPTSPAAPQVINTASPKKAVKTAKKAPKKDRDKAPEKEKANDGFRTLKTPFGDMKVQKK